MAGVKGFTFWENYYITISDSENGLSEDEKGQLYKALIEYVFDGRKPEFKGITRAIFSALLPSLELSKTRSKSRQNGNKTETNENQNQIKLKSKRNQKTNKTETNENQNEFCDLYINKKKESIILTDNTKRENIKGDSQGEKLNAQERFFNEFPSVVLDNYDSSVMSSLTEKDWEMITDQFRISEWLRVNVKTVSMLCNISTRILAGQYAPFKNVHNENDEDLSEKERQANADWFDKTFGKNG
jgi:hypothetical protein